MKPIVTVPNTVLSKVAQEVKVFDKKLHKTLLDMKEALIATTNPKGVGLAAPQIGISLRIFITRPHEKTDIRVFINPVITSPDTPDNSSASLTRTEQRDDKMEGCLSVPNLWGKVHRKKELTLSYKDEYGVSHQESFAGFMATIIQHETDHINGILFVQRVLEQKGKLFEIVKDEHGKEVFEEVVLK